MIKQINKLLRLVGLNLVRAKRKRAVAPILKNRTGDGTTHFVGDGCEPPHKL